jgi:NTE family protein
VHSTRERQNIHDVLLASCTFPPFYARIPRLDGAAHLDGGITDNTLIETLVARGARTVTVVTPHPDGAIYQALFRGFERPRLPAGVRLRILGPAKKLSLASFDFDPARVREALAMPHREVG